MGAVETMMVVTKRRALAAASALLIVLVGLFLVFRPGDQASAGVDLGDPHAWVEHGLDGELLQINATTGDVTARVEVAEPGQSFTAVQHGDGAVVLNTDTNSVSLVSGRLLAVTDNFEIEDDDEDEVASDDVETPGPVDRSDWQIFGSPAEAENVVVLSPERLLSIDPQSEAQTPIALPDPLRSAMQDESGGIVALSADADRILRLGPQGLDEFSTLADPVRDAQDLRSLVRAGDGIFVVDPSRLSVVELNSDGTFGLPFCTTSAVVGSVVGGSAQTGDPVIMAYNPTSSLLSVSEPGGGCFDVDVDVDLNSDSVGAPVAANGIAYIPNWGAGRIIVVNLDAERVVAVYPFGTPGVPFELEVVGSNVWANERQGPFAAVLDADSITPVSKLSTIVAGIAQTNDEGEGSSLTPGDADAGNLRIIGDRGEEVVASASADAPVGDGGTRGGEPDVFETADEIEFDQPQAVGIEIDALAIPEPEPIAEPDPDPEPIEPGRDAEEPEQEPLGLLIANFTASSGEAVVGEVLRFTDSSSGSPTSWTWDFGDGDGGTLPFMEKSWTEAGLYVVTLTVTNVNGDQSVQAAEITIVPETVLLVPTADFSFDRDTIEEGDSIDFTSRTTGEVDLLEWDFGDGQSSVGPTATHTYDTAGSYTITLTASNAAGPSTTSTEITVLTGVEPPKAAIAPLPSKIVTGQFVTLTSASLNEPTRLAWDLGDGTRGAGGSLQHAWAAPGTYRVRLVAENSEGTDETFTDVTVVKRVDPPVSQFTQSATEVRIGEVVTFTNLSLNEPTRLIWDFADGTGANGQTATKSWTKPGNYRVTLRATNEAGTNRTGVTIKVLKPVDPPVASFNASTLQVRTDTRIDFQDTSSNNPTAWSWNFGDTGVSDNRNTAHEWAKPGTYTVRLTVSNEGGSASAEKQVIVKNPPSANFRWEIVEGTTVKFTDTSWDQPDAYSWDFGDGNTSTERSPTHTFAGGAFDVTLVVSNDIGSSNPKTQEVVTERAPVARLSCTARGPKLDCTGAESARARGFTWTAEGAIVNSTPNQETTTFTFPAAGRYTVTLRVTNAAGADAKSIRGPRVTNGQKPRVTAVAVESIDSDLVTLVATFDRGPTEWEWEVDGAELIGGGAGPNPTFRVPNNGRFTGTVKASNLFGTDTDNFAFVANGIVTEAAFIWSNPRPGEIRFRNRSTATADAEYEWRFAGAPEILDDDNVGGPLVRYRDAGGTFRVVLIVTDVNGRSVYREDIVVPPVPPPE